MRVEDARLQQQGVRCLCLDAAAAAGVAGVVADVGGVGGVGGVVGVADVVGVAGVGGVVGVADVVAGVAAAAAAAAESGTLLELRRLATAFLCGPRMSAKEVGNGALPKGSRKGALSYFREGALMR